MPPPKKGQIGDACANNEACEDDLICLYSVCTEQPSTGLLGTPCTKQSSCSGRLVCVNGTCERPADGENGGACLHDGTCNGNLVCTDGTCDTATCPNDTYRSDKDIYYDCACETYVNRDAKCYPGIKSYDELVAVADKGKSYILLEDISVPTDRTFIPKLTSSLYGQRRGDTSAKKITASYTEDVSTGGALFGEIDGAKFEDIDLDLNIVLQGTQNDVTQASFGALAAKASNATLSYLSGKITLTGEIGIDNRNTGSCTVNIGGLVGNATKTFVTWNDIEMHFDVSQRHAKCEIVNVNAGGLVGSLTGAKDNYIMMSNNKTKGSTSLTLADDLRLFQLNMGSVAGLSSVYTSRIYSASDVRLNWKNISDPILPHMYVGGLIGSAEKTYDMGYKGSIVSTFHCADANTTAADLFIGGAFGESSGRVSSVYAEPTIRVTDCYAEGNTYIAGITADVTKSELTYQNDYARPAFNYYAYANSKRPFNTDKKKIMYAGIVAHLTDDDTFVTVNQSTADLGFQFRNSDALQTAEKVKSVSICGIGTVRRMKADRVVTTGRDTTFNPNMAQAIKTAWASLMRNEINGDLGCPIGGNTIGNGYYDGKIWPQALHSTPFEREKDKGVKVTVSSTGTAPDISNLFEDKTSLNGQIPYPSDVNTAMTELEKLKQ